MDVNHIDLNHEGRRVKQQEQDQQIIGQTVTHWLPRDQIDRLSELARMRRASRSQIMREAVEEYLQRQEAKVA